MSLESVFSVLTGWLVLNERWLTASEYVGCALIFAAVCCAAAAHAHEAAA